MREEMRLSYSTSTITADQRGLGCIYTVEYIGSLLKTLENVLIERSWNWYFQYVWSRVWSLYRNQRALPASITRSIPHFVAPPQINHTDYYKWVYPTE